MERTANSGHTIRFGVFEVDPHSRELRKGGRKVHVQDLPVRLLLALLKRPREVVTREELREALWPSDTYVDFDRSLHTAVAKLREALGDSAESPRFLETVPRRGYRFLADVETVAGALTLAEAPARARVAGSRSGLRWAVGGGVVALAATLIWLWAGKPKPTVPSSVPVPLTSYPGEEYAPSFSPDGNLVAFMWSGESRDNLDIYVKQIGTDKPVRLTIDPAFDFSPAWSPDGRFIAFGRELSPQKAGIFIIPAIGGPERKIAETASTRVHPFAAWSADSKSLVFSDVVAEEPFSPSAATRVRTEARSLFLLSLESGERRRLTFPAPSGEWDTGPAFSPDGRKLAFARAVSVGISDLYVLDLTSDLRPSREPRRLTFLRQFTIAPTWGRSGNEIVFASGAGSAGTHLWRASTSGSQPPRRLLSSGGVAEKHPAVSRQGSLAYALISSDSDIWRAELPTRGAKTNPASPFLASTRVEAGPQFSPDNRRIAFCSSRGGSGEIWVANEDGSSPMQLTSMGTFAGSPRWSPDGEWIVFDCIRQGQADLYIVRSTGGLPRRLTDNPANDAVPSWSRDGKLVYFMSTRTGTPQVWKVPGQGGPEVQVTKHGGFVAFESIDGKWIYYSTNNFPHPGQDVGDLRRIPTAGGDETRVLSSVTFLNFAVVRDGIYFIPPRDGEELYWLHFFSFATGASRRVLPLGKRVNRAGVSVSPDGRSLLYTQEREPESDLMLVENFE